MATEQTLTALAELVASYDHIQQVDIAALHLLYEQAEDNANLYHKADEKRADVNERLADLLDAIVGQVRGMLPFPAPDPDTAATFDEVEAAGLDATLRTPVGRLHGQTFTEWATELFEYELCDECHGDVDDHEPAVILGNWFAKCKKGGTDE